MARFKFVYFETISLLVETVKVTESRDASSYEAPTVNTVQYNAGA